MTTTRTAQDPGYSGHAVTGEHYDPNRYVTATEIAKHVRAAIKAAVKAGDLPADLTYRVRSDRYAGGQAVRINLVGAGEDATAWAFRDVTPEDAMESYRGVDRTYTDEAKRIARLVESFGKAYTREDVDSMADYFDVSCYVSVYCGTGGRCM